MPSAIELPLEIPRLILRNAEKKWRLNVAKTRIDLLADATKIGRNDFHAKALDLFSVYRKSTNAAIGRLALIITRFCEMENPGLSLATHFCKETWIATALNRPEDFKLHAFKKFRIDERIPEIN